MSNRDQFFQKMKSQLDDINAGIGELESKASQAKGDARTQYDKQIAELRQQSKDFASRLEALKDAGEEQWEKMSAETKNLADAFMHSYNYFKSQL